MGLLTGKKILVCGVANDHSMAWAIAKKAFDEGAEIALLQGTMSPDEKIMPLAQQLNAKFVQKCDVQSDSDMDALFARVKKEWGSLDGLVHAIAFSNKDELNGRYADTTRENFKMTMDISAFSMVDMARRSAELMTNGGSMITLTYLGGERVVPNYNVMGVAKAALESSVRYLASDFGANNIRVNAISAGPILTKAASGVGGFRQMLKLNESITPMRRNITLDDIAGAALYFLSNLSSGVTGEVHYVDCGYSTTGMLPNDMKDMLLKAIDSEESK
jgi:enoyl-[acyl-carrier protein] reductase I